MSFNVSNFDAYKMDSTPFLCDAKLGLKTLATELRKRNYKSGYRKEIETVRAEWRAEVDRLYITEMDGEDYSQLRALGLMSRNCLIQMRSS